ncbi:hypothetical protein HYALB_00013022 [Hymenoscyphus albidus]|uniref:Elongin-A n=1 Tax=Hymenoscyphus albidus TaxID=595503 RepID=A0A9N9LMZ5_9HELO|nr:hypothetical protein HYALB_00013022 [Hymenoscyphus albidus]
MPAPSLVESCTRACIKNLRSLTDIGDFEYFKIRDILKYLSSPEQLHQIEVNSPQIRGEDAELWQKFIARDIPNWEKKNWAPKDGLKWYEVYRKYKKAQAQEIARDEEVLRNAMQGLKQHKETHVSKIVDARTLPKLPRDPRMLANGGTPRKKGLNLQKAPPSSLVWSGGSKTKMVDSKGVFARAKREAREIKAMGKLSVPTHQLAGSRKQIVQAPAGMVNQYRTAAQPPIKILAKRKHASSTFSGGISGPSLEDREAKLRALTSGGKKAAPVSRTMVDPEDDDDDDDLLASGNDYKDEEEDDDDLFDEKPKLSRPTSKPPHSRPVAVSSSSRVPSANGAPASSAPPKPMLPRKRPPVDIFNRGPKKVRR